MPGSRGLGRVRIPSVATDYIDYGLIRRRGRIQIPCAVRSFGRCVRRAIIAPKNGRIALVSNNLAILRVMGLWPQIRIGREHRLQEADDAVRVGLSNLCEFTFRPNAFIFVDRCGES